MVETCFIIKGSSTYGCLWEYIRIIVFYHTTISKGMHFKFAACVSQWPKRCGQTADRKPAYRFLCWASQEWSERNNMWKGSSVCPAQWCVPVAQRNTEGKNFFLFYFLRFLFLLSFREFIFPRITHLSFQCIGVKSISILFLWHLIYTV